MRPPSVELFPDGVQGKTKLINNPSTLSVSYMDAVDAALQSKGVRYRAKELVSAPAPAPAPEPVSHGYNLRKRK